MPGEDDGPAGQRRCTRAASRASLAHGGVLNSSAASTGPARREQRRVEEHPGIAGRRAQSARPSRVRPMYSQLWCSEHAQVRGDEAVHRDRVLMFAGGFEAAGRFLKDSQRFVEFPLLGLGEAALAKRAPEQRLKTTPARHRLDLDKLGVRSFELPPLEEDDGLLQRGPGQERRVGVGEAGERTIH